MRRLFFSMVMLFSTGFAEAAVVYLKDGSQVRGTIVSATARDLQVQAPDGPLTITTDRIDRIDYRESAPAYAPEPPVQTAPSPRYYPRDEEGRQTFSLGFGVAAPLSRVDLASTGGGSDTNGNPGLLISGQYLVGVDKRLNLGMTTEFFNRSGTSSQSLLPESNTDVSGTSLVFLATAKYYLVTRGLARPYLLGGVGTHRTSTIIEATPNIGFGWSDTSTAETRTLVDQRHWGFASTARFGVDFTMSEPTFFGLEIGWTRLNAPTYGATVAGRDLGLESVTGNQDALMFAARWGWRF